MASRRDRRNSRTPAISASKASEEGATEMAARSTGPSLGAVALSIASAKLQVLQRAASSPRSSTAVSSARLATQPVASRMQAKPSANKTGKAAHSKK